MEYVRTNGALIALVETVTVTRRLLGCSHWDALYEDQLLNWEFWNCELCVHKTLFFKIALAMRRLWAVFSVFFGKRLMDTKNKWFEGIEAKALLNVTISAITMPRLIRPGQLEPLCPTLVDFVARFVAMELIGDFFLYVPWWNCDGNDDGTANAIHSWSEVKGQEAVNIRIFHELTCTKNETCNVT